MASSAADTVEDEKIRFLVDMRYESAKEIGVKHILHPENACCQRPLIAKSQSPY